MTAWHPSWNPLFEQYEIDLDSIYNNSTLPVYPARADIFRAFSLPVSEIRLVLLGQDPYHGPDQAHGLSFSVPLGQPIPPSLQNIFKELQLEFPERAYKFPHGNLIRWQQEEKIFLFNSSLTVLQGQPNSHADLWKDFSDDVIRFIVANNSSCAYLLLGAYAKSKAVLIGNPSRVVAGVHPSPLSAHRGFFGSGIFRSCEERLGSKIDWSL